MKTQPKRGRGRPKNKSKRSVSEPVLADPSALIYAARGLIAMRDDVAVYRFKSLEPDREWVEKIRGILATPKQHWPHVTEANIGQLGNGGL